MTRGGLEAIIAKHGAENLIALGFDNDKASYYINSDILKNEYIVTLGDSDYVMTQSTILNQKTGKYDIPVTAYKPIANIQTIIVLDNPADRPNIQAADLRMR